MAVEINPGEALGVPGEREEAEIVILSVFLVHSKVHVTSASDIFKHCVCKVLE